MARTRHDSNPIAWCRGFVQTAVSKARRPAFPRRPEVIPPARFRYSTNVSITLPPDLLVKAQELATREHRTMSERFRQALRRYMTADTQWENLLSRTRGKGKALGIKNEDDVERLSDEYRRDGRR